MVMVSVSKEPGYISPPVQIFQYGPVGNLLLHRPTVVDPIVFTLHRKKSEEPLFVFSNGFLAPNTGQSVKVDFTTGKPVRDGGDIIVSIYCPEPYTNLKRFPWKLSVQVVGGGLIQADARRLSEMHEAPLGAYVSDLLVDHTSIIGDWDSQ